MRPDADRKRSNEVEPDMRAAGGGTDNPGAGSSRACTSRCWGGVGWEQEGGKRGEADAPHVTFGTPVR